MSPQHETQRHTQKRDKDKGKGKGKEARKQGQCQRSKDKETRTRTGEEKKKETKRERERAERTCVVRKQNAEVHLADFLSEEVFLVQEQDDGGVDEPLVVDGLVEEQQAFLHAVRLVVFVAIQVVPGWGVRGGGVQCRA